MASTGVNMLIEECGHFECTCTVLLDCPSNYKCTMLNWINWHIIKRISQKNAMTVCSKEHHETVHIVHLFNILCGPCKAKKDKRCVNLREYLINLWFYIKDNNPLGREVSESNMHQDPRPLPGSREYITSHEDNPELTLSPKQSLWRWIHNWIDSLRSLQSTTFQRAMRIVSKHLFKLYRSTIYDLTYCKIL